MKLKKTYKQSVLAVACIALVGMVTTTLMQNNAEDALRRSSVLSEGVIVPKLPVGTVSPTVAPKPVASEQPLAVQKTMENKSVVSSVPFRIILPVQGEVLQSFSGEELIYHKTFEDWRVHHGIDIGAERSAPVYACADGIIQDIYTDSLEGITVVIDHGNAFISVYKNLSGDKMVQKGQKIQQGQAISGVGETGVAEAGLPYHLHFELLYQGEQVDPSAYY